MLKKVSGPLILINTYTHGDETIGLSVAKKLHTLKLLKGEVRINIANAEAAKLKKRFIDQDLNRAFPGNPKGNHEEKVAAQLLPLIKSADVVIDIHSTTSELKDALIVTKLNAKTKEYVTAIAPKYLLCMSVTKNNALISHAKVGIAFEYGKDKDPKAINKTVGGIKRLLSHLKMIAPISTSSKNKPIFFTIHKSVSKPSKAKLATQIKNYKLVKKGDTYATAGETKLKATSDFYPILFGQDNYEEIFGFAGKLIK